MRPTIALHVSFTVTALAIAATTFLACNSDVPAPNDQVTARTSAVTTSAPTDEPTFRRGNDYGAPPNAAPPKQTARSPVVAVSEHPFHVRNKLVEKPARAAAVAPPPTPPAAYVAKQNEYIEKWRELEATKAGLSPGEQDARRAALKRSVLGE